jgi:hypothetical protein
MGIAVYVENLLHERIGEIFDDPQGTIARLCDEAPPRSVRGAVSPHGDTMFNVYQLRLLKEELAELPEGPASELVAALAQAAERAIRARGYLYFVGD